MSYILGAITLPNPKVMKRGTMEKSGKIITLNNTTKKDITGRKEVFVLQYTMLSQAEIASILSEYNLQTTRNFSVSETNLTIPPTLVHIEIGSRDYNTLGDEYREDITLVLEEVQ